jgi:hypothetical protein
VSKSPLMAIERSMHLAVCESQSCIRVASMRGGGECMEVPVSSNARYHVLPLVDSNQTGILQEVLHDPDTRPCRDWGWGSRKVSYRYMDRLDLNVPHSSEAS